LKRALRRRDVARYAAKGYSLAAVADILGVGAHIVAEDYRAVLAEMQEQRKKLGELAFERHINQLETLIERLQELVFKDDVSDRTIGRYLQALQERAKLLDLYPKGDDRPEIEINLVYTDHRALPKQETPDIVEGEAETIPVLPGNTGDFAADLLGIDQTEYQEIYQSKEKGEEEHDSE
jgi:hypothetical protein